jgi:glycosyltransferase involved in cell wall biosynthesis
MLVSVIICTYKRPDCLEALLRHLSAQTYRDFEVLVIDGCGPKGAERSALCVSTAAPNVNVRVIPSEKGLPRQRNVGLKASQGDLICLLDDDVTFDADFLQKMVAVFEHPDMRDVGGLSAYDILNYPQRINRRWRLRNLFRTVPSLRPGDIDRLGRAVPVSFLEPFSGCKPVGFFYGFCMVFRAEAIRGMSFDEALPTYGGEDRDFSFRVSKRSHLMICGDLHLRHFQTLQSRDSGVHRIYQTGFGAGRTFAKHHTRILDYLVLLWTLGCEFMLDSLAFLLHPSWDRFLGPFARAAGIVGGLRSYRLSDDPSAVKAVR